MPVIDPFVGPEDGWDSELAPDGRYELLLRELKIDENDKGEDRYTALIDFEGVQEDYETIFMTFTKPGPERTTKARKFLEGQWRGFLSLFGKRAEDPLDVDEIVGEIFESEVGTDEYKGKKKNILVLPRMRKSDG